VGRRSVRLDDQARWVFNRLADHYLTRPAYPNELVDRLATLAGGPGARVADLGAGVGHLSLPLSERGLRVTAVEPALAMLDALKTRRGHAPIELVHATAEATNLPGGAFDLVLFADAVQWVDPELAGLESARLLAPGGRAAVVETAFAPTPFMDGLSALLATRNPKARPRPAGASRQLLALAAPGSRPNEERFHQEALLDDAGLEGFVRSLSYAGPALGPDQLASLVSSARALAQSLDGACLRRELTLRWGAKLNTCC
jgi:ubiquinone/menaquinone biosynthesis C-methylase UbiE